MPKIRYFFYKKGYSKLKDKNKLNKVMDNQEKMKKMKINIFYLEDR